MIASARERRSSHRGARFCDFSGVALLRRLNRFRFSKLPPLSQVPRVIDPPADDFNRYFVDQGSQMISVGATPFRDKLPTLADMLSGPVQDVEVRVRRVDYAHVASEARESPHAPRGLRGKVHPAG